jgi:hypothetical protein
MSTPLVAVQIMPANYYLKIQSYLMAMLLHDSAIQQWLLGEIHPIRIANTKQEARGDEASPHQPRSCRLPPSSCSSLILASN